MKGKINGNKIKGILLIAIFILTTIFAGISIVHATPTIDPALTSGNVGDVITVSGASDTPGGLIEVYWNEVHPWDPDIVTGFLNSTYASGIAYSLEITVPETIQEDYTVIVKDVEASTFISDDFTVNSKITVTPISGLPGDPIDMTGTGFAAEEIITTMTFNKLNPIEEEAVGTGPGTTFSLEYYPVEPGTETIYLDVTGEAVGTGGIATETLTLPYDNLDAVTAIYADLVLLATPADYTFVLGTGVITWVTSQDGLAITADYDLTLIDATDYDFVDSTGGIELTTSAPTEAVITADYSLEDKDILPTTELVTDDWGSFETISFDVPDVPYGDDEYEIIATGDSANSDDFTFSVGATITLEPAEGPLGAIVDITGIGFGFVPDVDVAIEIGGVTATEVEAIKTEDDGTFSGQFIVPTLTIDTHTVEATAGLISGTLDFEVTGLTVITLEPTSGSPGSDVIIEGVNFTAIVDTVVTIGFGAFPTYTTLMTNSTGGFKETISVPQLTPSPTAIDVIATDSNDLTDTAQFRVVLTTLAVSPSKGPTGTNVLVIGGGFSLDMAYNVTIDGKLMIDGTGTTEAGDGSMTTNVYVPTLPTDDYTITVMDEEGITGTATFEVTETTELILTPDNGPETYPISLEANYFTENLGTDITITLYNETAGERDYEKVFLTTDITAATDFTSIETNLTGFYEGTFDVPDLATGDYIINATDVNGLTVETSFSVVDISIDIDTQSTEYEPSDTVSFYISSTFAFDLEIVVEEPTGYPFTTIGPILEANWVVMDDYYVVPLADATFDLPSDAMTGLWNWTAYDVTDSGSVEVDYGNFTVGEVVEPPEYPADTTGQETLDSTGAPATSFVMGESILASASVENVGTESQYMLIVYKLTDQGYHTIINYADVTLPPGIALAPKLNFNIPDTGYTPGTWTLTVMIIDDWPALGGEMLGEPVTFTFTVE